MSKTVLFVQSDEQLTQSLGRFLSRSFAVELVDAHPVKVADALKNQQEIVDIKNLIVLAEAQQLVNNQLENTGMQLLAHLRWGLDYPLSGVPVVLMSCESLSDLIGYSEGTDRLILKSESYDFFSFSECQTVMALRDLISKAERLTPSQVGQAQDWHPIRTIQKQAQRLLSQLELDASDVEACQKEYEELLRLLTEHLPGYFGDAWKESITEGLEQVRQGRLSEAIRSEIRQQMNALIDAVLGAFAVKVFGKYWGHKENNLLFRWTGRIDLIPEKGLEWLSDIDQGEYSSQCWRDLSDRVIPAIEAQFHQIKTAAKLLAVPFAQELATIQAAVCEFGDWIGEIKRGQVDMNDPEAWNAKRRQAVDAIDRIQLACQSIVNQNQRL